jgi:protein SCO1/2
MDFFPDEGLMNHSLHTAVINRERKLVANIEGNQYSAEQLGDLVETVLAGQQKRQASIDPK